MALQVGDIIAARLVATVTGIDATAITVTSSGGTQVVFPVAIRNDRGFTWDKINAPEPAYITGEPYRDKSGGLFLRIGSTSPNASWQVLFHPGLPIGQLVGEGTPVHPLTHLVDEATQPAPAP